MYVSSHGSRVRDDAFSALLRRLPSRNVLVLIDACHSGTAYKAIRLDNASLGETEARTKFFDYPDVPGDDGGQADAAVVDKDAKARGSQSDNFVFLSAAADDEQALATNKGSVSWYLAGEPALGRHSPMCGLDAPNFLALPDTSTSHA